MKWQSEEHVGLAEAAEWARHFGQLERDMDTLLGELLGISASLIASWMSPGRYVGGREFAEAGLGELIDVKAMPRVLRNGSATPRRRARVGS